MEGQGCPHCSCWLSSDQNQLSQPVWCSFEIPSRSSCILPTRYQTLRKLTGWTVLEERKPIGRSPSQEYSCCSRQGLSLSSLFRGSLHCKHHFHRKPDIPEGRLSCCTPRLVFGWQCKSHLLS